MNKKGFVFLTEEQMNLVIYSLLIIFVFGVLIMTTYLNIDRTIDTVDLEKYTLVNNFLFSSDCVSYDDGFRTYPGIIDFDKFNEERVSACISYPSSRIGFKVELMNFEKEIIKEFEINKVAASQGLLCGMKDSNLDCYTASNYVLYRNDSKLERGYLNIKVVSILE
jgi:hypothetical protein